MCACILEHRSCHSFKMTISRPSLVESTFNEENHSPSIICQDLDTGQTCCIKRLICEQLFAKSTFFQSLLNWQPFLLLNLYLFIIHLFSQRSEAAIFITSQFSIQNIKIHSELEHYGVLIRAYFPE